MAKNFTFWVLGFFFFFFFYFAHIISIEKKKKMINIDAMNGPNVDRTEGVRAKAKGG